MKQIKVSGPSPNHSYQEFRSWTANILLFRDSIFVYRESLNDDTEYPALYVGGGITLPQLRKVFHELDSKGTNYKNAKKTIIEILEYYGYNEEIFPQL